MPKKYGSRPRRKTKYTVTNEPGTDLYGIAADDGLLYEPTFTLAEARRLLQCLRKNDNFTWSQCADYVESRTDVLPSMRKLAAVLIAAILLSLANGAQAQVILPNPPHCTECYMTWLAVVHTSNVEGQGVQP